jgi:hypothetical protein
MVIKRKDWLWIQKRYEMGYTVRQTAKDYSREYQDTVSFQAIAKVARKNNRHRELTERYRKSVEHKIVEKAKSQQLVGYLAKPGDKVDVSDDDSDEVAIDDASDISSQVVLEHQLNAQGLREAAMDIIGEIYTNKPYTVVTKDGSEFKVQAELPKRAQVRYIAAKALFQAVTIKRTSLTLDCEDGLKSGGGVFQIISNGPEPDPLPPEV